MTAKPLSNLAQRVLDLFHRIAVDSYADVTWSQVTRTLKCGRTSLAAAIRELKAASLVEQVAHHGHTARYCILNAEQTPETGNQETEGCTSAHQSALVRTSTSDDLKNDFSDDDDEALPEFKKLQSLLGEFLIEEPTRSRLAEILLPMVNQEPAIRAVCVKTLQEPNWRNPRGVIVRRLEALATGQQDPLPVFASVLAHPVATPAVKRSAARTPRKGGVSRRPQLEYTDQQREAARQSAARRVAERAARRQGVAIGAQ